MIIVSSLPESHKDWFDQVARDYFLELIPTIGNLPPGFLDPLFSDTSYDVKMIVADEECVGFAIIKRHEVVSELAEFCVLPMFRNRGVGAIAAKKCFEENPGHWTLGVAGSLPGTARFWDSILPKIDTLEELEQTAPTLEGQSHGYTFFVRHSK
ncbi:GNAT family N-acetyltransferase [uncultured Tateyamaria sp.]|uniref:GNAT family N-acetyltransferase n=1 Tax=uncultured Tateyamaria sp. TaxID=455651 RepID=UPI00260B013D|nr:GNAT family N-acetyltransferase [uncultured Tateyamaria sp.]